MKPVKTFSLAGYTAKVYKEEYPEYANPRDCDVLGTIALRPCSDSRAYVAGDDDAPKFDTVEDMAAFISETRAVALPVYVWADWTPEVNTEGRGEHCGFIYCPLLRCARNTAPAPRQRPPPGSI